MLNRILTTGHFCGIHDYGLEVEGPNVLIFVNWIFEFERIHFAISLKQIDIFDNLFVNLSFRDFEVKITKINSAKMYPNSIVSKMSLDFIFRYKILATSKTRSLTWSNRYLKHFKCSI